MKILLSIKTLPGISLFPGGHLEISYFYRVLDKVGKTSRSVSSVLSVAKTLSPMETNTMRSPCGAQASANIT